jgi:AraC-like DNA-binding protein
MISAGGRLAADLLVERYTYLPGPPTALPRHVHEDYQLCYNPDYAGQVWHGGSWHIVPRGRVAVVSPGETHAVRDVAQRETSGEYRVLYVAPRVIDGLATQAGCRPSAGQMFRGLTQADGPTVEGFLRLHASLDNPAPQLERDARLHAVLGQLITQHGVYRPVNDRIASSRRAAHVARDHLRDHLVDNVSLADLSRVANLSPYHLLRVFHREFGMPPHTYQVRARVDRARRIIAAGHTVAHAAYDSGFFDSSHLTRHFRLIVGVTPGRYGAELSTGRRGHADVKMHKQ